MKKSFLFQEALAMGYVQADPTAEIAETVIIVAYEDDEQHFGPVIIGAGCIIREFVVICSGTVIMQSAMVGHGTVIRQRVSIGKEVVLSHHVSIERGSRIGDRVRISAKSHITGDCIIEDDVQIGAGVMTINDRDLKYNRQPVLIAPIFRKGCRVGSGSTVMSGAEIGENTIVGAGSLVLTDLPANTIAYGSPAYVQKSLAPKETQSNTI